MLKQSKIVLCGVVISLLSMSTAFADGVLDLVGSQNFNSANTYNIRIVSKDIQPDNDPNMYGVLLNNQLTGENCDIISNIIYSPTTDAVEINTTSGEFRGVKIIGNTLYGGEDGTGINGGFSIGIAKGKEVVVVGNISKVSRQEALHIEDTTEDITVSNNIFTDCMEDGARLLYRPGSSPVILTNNIFKKRTTMIGQDYGIYLINDTYGTLRQNIIANNIVDGFSCGLMITGSSTVANNLAKNCNVAIRNTAEISGTNFASDCDTLLAAGNGSVTDKIVSYTQPETIMNFIGTSGLMGATLKGFSFPISSFSVPQGYSTFTLFDLPSRMTGKIMVKFSVNYDVMYYTADVVWNGTDLTVSNILKSNGGVFAAPQLQVTTEGELAFKFYAAGSRTISNTKLDFEGIYYQK